MNSRRGKSTSQKEEATSDRRDIRKGWMEGERDECVPVEEAQGSNKIQSKK